MENDANESKKLEMLPGCLTASLIAPRGEQKAGKGSGLGAGAEAGSLAGK